MILVLIIAGVWLVGCLLVLGICAQAAAGDRALAERRGPALDVISPPRRFTRGPVDRALTL